jgi:polysaccharide pyruvyl transferase WcaK-like protein
VNQRVHRIAFYGFLGSGNIGNDASLETVLAWLRLLARDVEVQCITIAPEEVTARYGLRSVPLAWRSSHSGGNRVMKVCRKLFGRLFDIPHSYAMAGAVGAVIVPGMGVLEETLAEQPWGLPFWLLLIAAACRIRGRRFVLLDVGAEWAANPLTRWLHVATVRLATHVSYRDLSSQTVMARAGPRDPEAVAPDLVFAHPASRLTKPEVGRIVVGVMAYYGRGDDPIRGADVRRRYVGVMTDALSQMAEGGDQVVLVGGDRVDVEVAHQIRSAVLTACPRLSPEAVLVREVTTFTELTDEMMRGEVIVASRFHNLICALRLAKPTVSIGYASKCRHLMEALGLDDYHQGIEYLDATRLSAQIGAARQNRVELRAQIEHGGAEYAQDVESLLHRVVAEELGLATQAPGRHDIHDGMGVWHGA